MGWQCLCCSFSTLQIVPDPALCPDSAVPGVTRPASCDSGFSVDIVPFHRLYSEKAVTSPSYSCRNLTSQDGLGGRSV